MLYSSSDYPAMNTRGKTLKRNLDTQQSQHLEKKMKITNMLEKELIPLAEEAAVDVQITENLSPIQKLNDHCLEEIFMYLSLEERVRIELVCKKWRSVNESVSRSLQKIDYPYVDLDWEERKITHPHTNFSVHESLLDFKLRFNHVPRCLVLRGQYVQDLDLSALTKPIILKKLNKISFPHLIKLKLRIHTAWLAKYCDNLFKKMTKLRSLHVTTDYRLRIPITFIKALSALANTLQELSIINFMYHQYSEEMNWCNTLWSKKQEYYLPMMTGLKSLRSLELKGFYLGSVKHLRPLRHLNLKKLVVARCILREVDNLYPILNLKTLEELALGPCDENIDIILKGIPRNLNNLTKLVLFQPNATDDAIQEISSLKKFKTLIVNDHKELAKIIYT